jgi:hypothetical protein
MMVLTTQTFYGPLLPRRYWPAVQVTAKDLFLSSKLVHRLPCAGFLPYAAIRIEVLPQGVGRRLKD